MAKKTRKVYFSAICIRTIMDWEEIKDHKVIKDIFDRIVANYAEAEKTGNFGLFQKNIDREADEKYFVSMLHNVGNNLCGVISHGTPKMERYLRQRNPETYDIKELVPEKGTVFEEYSFFAISPEKMQMAYLSDPAISTNIPDLVLKLLRQAINQNYEFEERSIEDTDIKNKIKQLGNNVTVRGTLIGKEESVSGGVRSVRSLERTMGTRFSATIKIRAKLGRMLTDKDIDCIRELATQEEGYSSFIFADERDADHEIIDVIKNNIRLTKKIDFSITDSPNTIWEKLCTSFFMG